MASVSLVSRTGGLSVFVRRLSCRVLGKIVLRDYSSTLVKITHRVLGFKRLLRLSCSVSDRAEEHGLDSWLELPAEELPDGWKPLVSVDGYASRVSSSSRLLTHSAG